MKKAYNKVMKESLYRNSIFLMISSGITAALGFFSWLICARLFGAEEVGIATTMISAIGLIVSFSLLGLNTGLIKYLPSSENKNNKINTCITIASITTIIVSAIFILGLDKFSPKLDFMRDNLLLSFGFIFFAVVFSLSSITDSIFISLRKAEFILLKNSIFGILRVVLPFVLVGLGVYGIFGSYALSLTAGVIFVILILIYKYKYKPKFVFYDSVIRRIGKFSFGNYVAGFIGGLSLLILPLLITNKIGAETTAYYFMAVQIANLLFVIPSASTSSLFAEGSHDIRKLKEKTLKAIRIIAILIIPSILAIIFLGNYVLLAFGKEYSNQGIEFLKIMALSGIFVSINSVFGSVFKVRNKVKYIIIVNVIGVSAILGLSYFFIQSGRGLVGVGIAWIIGQIAMNLGYLIFNKAKGH